MRREKGAVEKETLSKDELQGSSTFIEKENPDSRSMQPSPLGSPSYSLSLRGFWLSQTRSNFFLVSC